MPLSQEIVEAIPGSLNSIDSLSMEDYEEFPFSRQGPVFLRDPALANAEKAKISYCTECRKGSTSRSLSNAGERKGERKGTSERKGTQLIN